MIVENPHPAVSLAKGEAMKLQMVEHSLRLFPCWRGED
jgi:hypothetical protein